MGYKIVAWISLFMFWMYTHATYISFKGVPFAEIWYISMLCWGFSILFILIYETFGKITWVLPSLIVWLLSVVVVLVPGIFIMYDSVFDKKFGSEPLYAIYQTNYREAYEFSGMHNSSFSTVALLLVIGTLLALLIKQGTRHRELLSYRSFLIMAAVLLLIANLDVPFKMKIPNMISKSIEVYFGQLAEFKKLQDERQIDGGDLIASKENGKELYVFIIGESLNKNHMGLYGYHRNTSPLLEQMYEDSLLLRYEEAFSTHTHTVPVLIKALTSANHANAQKYYTSPSILDMFEAADFDTYWLTNQMSYGPFDNPLTVLSARADNRISINGHLGDTTVTLIHDEGLIPKLERIVADDLSKNTAIFIHLIGNHGDYKDRYPLDREIYKGELDSKQFGKGDIWAEQINAYDNSVHYNDSVVHGLFNAVLDVEGPATCMYFSDHSEEIIKNKGHNSSVFTYTMTQIPMIIWCSDGYKETYPGKYANLKVNTERLFSTDLFFELALGMTGVTTDLYEKRFDISDDRYELLIEDCYSIDGRFYYGDSTNFHYHMRMNSSVLDSLNMKARVYPHRINSIGKLSSAQYHGFNSFELDVLFREGYFEVGHDEGAMSGMSLKELLSYTSTDQLQKLWLDVKNINDDIIPDVLKRLEELDKIFDLKKYAIIESGTTSPRFSEFADAGYHTSYYVPTDIVDLEISSQPNKARQIADQVQRQHTTAVSFDYRLYTFVKEHLEPLLDPNIVYHTWNLSLELADPNFKYSLLETETYRDARVKSILISYRSEFDL